MKVQSINSLYNPFRYQNLAVLKNSNNVQTNPFLSSAKGDTVSFGAKNYDAETIVNPTAHCAYCGCKVYTDAQLDSITKEILANKASKSEGRIRSVLEKLEGAKHSQELAVAKRMENEPEIEFFKKLLDLYFQFYDNVIALDQWCSG